MENMLQHAGLQVAVSFPPCPNVNVTYVILFSKSSAFPYL